jgi:suppressor for copper-sensitivity B
MSHLRWAVARCGMLVMAALFATASAQAATPVEIKAWLNTPRDGKPARLSVQASLAEGWHTYSTTSDVRPTQITLQSSGRVRQAGAFRAEVEPQLEIDDGKAVGKHTGAVTWSAPLELPGDADLTSLRISGKINLLVCEKQFCQPHTETFVALVNQAQGESTPAETKQKSPAIEDVLGGPLGGLPGAGGSGDVVSVKARIAKAEGDKPAQLVVEATIESGWHIYSLTQPKGGPVPTKITVELGGNVQFAEGSDWTADPAPKKHFDSIFGINVEEHEGRVRWTRPLKIGSSAAEGMKIAGKVSAQSCNATGCLPPKDFAFEVVNTTKTSVGEFRANRQSHVLIRGHFEPTEVAPGGRVKAVLTAVPDARYHIYAVNSQPKAAKPTILAIKEHPRGWTAGEPVADSKPSVHKGDLVHEQPVTWTVEIDVPKDAVAGSYLVKGVMAYQVCYVGGCDLPQGTEFVAQVTVASAATNKPEPLAFSALSYDSVVQALEPANIQKLREKYLPVVDALKHALGMELFSQEELQKLTAVNVAQLQIPLTESQGWSAIVAYVVFGFLGGLILNIMPCVLPVIGLKVMSFVHQAGESRARIFALNAWFSLGLMSVFLALAALAAFAGLGWGQQFQEAWFTMVLTCVVFAFALALLGVWEVPIPGFVGSGAAADLASKEGAAGAFSKGVLTTVLATPCTGPFLGPALAWAVKQPLPVVFLTFAAVGLGMASPFLLIGAFPKLIAFLPKPGAWMDTFKKLMGFVLLATVVWLLSFLEPVDVVPAVIVMCGLGLALWWIGHTQMTATTAQKARAWALAAATTIAATYIGFGWFDDVMKSRLDRRFEAGVTKFLNKFLEKPIAPDQASRPPGKYTVMVDFTADW